MRCSNCNTDNPDRAKFSIECGTAIRNRCSNCGFDNPARAKFGAECGTPLDGITSQPGPQPVESPSLIPAPNLQYLYPTTFGERIRTEQGVPEASGAVDGERKTITTLFADFKGSMELIEDLDPEEARSIIDPAPQLMIDAVHRYEGYVAQSMGMVYLRSLVCL